jgi:hypothetical protein
MSLLLFLQVDGFSQRQQDDDHAIRGLAGACNISFDPVNAAFTNKIELMKPIASLLFARGPNIHEENFA